jgi:hypothetical protein
VPLARRAATTDGRSAGAAPSGRCQTQTKENNDSLHNQWQMGNFLPQKQLKTGVEVLLVLY